jgi:hypothetical protein
VRTIQEKTLPFNAAAREKRVELRTARRQNAYSTAKIRESTPSDALAHPSKRQA